ncbi:PAS domain-containing protein [Candidatus Kuenenia sp.]|uniref:PAS domain-containing protein n=1 Tax=Candidatus Kuenenia sp. TaxID=2499824 RepID=UPI00322056D8
MLGNALSYQVRLIEVGYLILNEKGFILAANFAGAFMLGIEPHALTNKPLSKYIVKEDTDASYKGV